MTMDYGKEACFPRSSRTQVSCLKLSVITSPVRKTARLVGDRSFPRSYCDGLCWTGSCILCGQRVWTHCLMRNWSCHWLIVNTSVLVVSVFTKTLNWICKYQCIIMGFTKGDVLKGHNLTFFDKFSHMFYSFILETFWTVTHRYNSYDVWDQLHRKPLPGHNLTLQYPELCPWHSTLDEPVWVLGQGR